MQETRVSVPGALGHVSGSGGKKGLNQLVYGEPAVKTLLLTLAGMRPLPSTPPEERGQGACKGPISCKGGWRNYPAKVVMNYRRGGGRPRISYV